MNIDYARQILDLGENYDQDQLKQAYMRCTSAAHSEDLPDSEKSTKLNLLNKAYDFLLREQSSPLIPNPKTAFDSAKPTPEKGMELALVDNPADFRVCPECSKFVPKGILNCTYCGTQIARHCPACGELAERGEKICKRCGVVLEDYDKQKFLKVFANEQRVKKDRENLAEYVEAVERENKRFIVTGLWIWLLIILGFFAILAVAVYVYYLYF